MQNLQYIAWVCLINLIIYLVLYLFPSGPFTHFYHARGVKTVLQIYTLNLLILTEFEYKTAV